MFTFVYSLGCTGDTLCDLLLLGVNQIDDEFPSITGWQVRFVPVQKSALSGLEHSTFERIQCIPGITFPGFSAIGQQTETEGNSGNSRAFKGCLLSELYVFSSFNT